MASDDEPAFEFLGCRPVSMGPSAVADSTISKCAACGEQIWIAPTGVAFLKQRKEVIAVCIPCGLDAAEDGVLELRFARDEVAN